MLDPLDRQILEALQLNARVSTSALARRLESSRSTIQSRIDRLEDTGVISGYTLRLGQDFSDSLIRAHVLISISPKFAKRVAQSIEKLTDVRALHTISGAFDMIAEIATESMERLDHVTDHIGAIPGVERTQTSVLMSTRFSRL